MIHTHTLSLSFSFALYTHHTNSPSSFLSFSLLRTLHSISHKHSLCIGHGIQVRAAGAHAQPPRWNGYLICNLWCMICNKQYVICTYSIIVFTFCLLLIIACNIYATCDISCGIFHIGITNCYTFHIKCNALCLLCNSLKSFDHEQPYFAYYLLNMQHIIKVSIRNNLYYQQQYMNSRYTHI